MQEKIITLCGIYPDGFEKIIPTNSMYIFQSDPLFTPINLYSFFGSAATVNSFAECYYYAELGFNSNEFNIFDLGVLALLFLFGAFIIYRFTKSNYLSFSEAKNFILDLKKYIAKTLVIKKIRLTFLTFFIFIQNFFIFDYYRTASVRIPNFIDEYISLTSNVNFFRNLDFNAGEFLGGSYSIYLTSGPISAVGGVIGWNLTKSLSVARITNIYWLILLQLIFILILTKIKKTDYFFIFSISFLLITLIPWWKSGLYLLGEIASMIIFVNSIFLFKTYRKISLTLISVSIFYGKLLTLLPFLGFYLVIFLKEKNIKILINDIIQVLIPYLLYIVLVYNHIENFQISTFLQSQIDLFLNHQSSGISDFSLNGIVEKYRNSEAIQWELIDSFRIFLLPLITVFLIIRNKNSLDNYFFSSAYSLVTAIIFPYLWFWLLSPTKWIRYSQHFMITCILILIYLIVFDILSKKTDILITFTLIALLSQQYSEPIYIFISLLFYLYVLFSKNNDIGIRRALIVFLLSVGIVFPFYQKDTYGNLSFTVDDCTENLLTNKCKDSYMNE